MDHIVTCWKLVYRVTALYKETFEHITLSYLCQNDMPNPSNHQTNKSQFEDDAGQWAVSINIDLAAEYLPRDLDKLARWCVKWRIKLNLEILQVPNCNQGRTCFIFIWRLSFVLLFLLLFLLFFF